MSLVVAFPLLILLAVRHANGVPVASWVTAATVATASQLESSPSDGPDWVSAANMSTARTDLGLAALDGKL